MKEDKLKRNCTRNKKIKRKKKRKKESHTSTTYIDTCLAFITE